MEGNVTSVHRHSTSTRQILETRDEVQDSSSACVVLVSDILHIHVGELKEKKSSHLPLHSVEHPRDFLLKGKGQYMPYFHTPERSYKQQQNKDRKGRILDLCQHFFLFGRRLFSLILMRVGKITVMD